MKKKISGNRKRAFKPRAVNVPAAVHVLMEFMYDMCLELGICPTCKLRPLWTKAGKTYNKCEKCTTWQRTYTRERQQNKRMMEE